MNNLIPAFRKQTLGRNIESSRTGKPVMSMQLIAPMSWILCMTGVYDFTYCTIKVQKLWLVHENGERTLNTTYIQSHLILLLKVKPTPKASHASSSSSTIACTKFVKTEERYEHNK